MKKQIISVMLSAAICMTSPLFAMDKDDFEPYSGSLSVLSKDNLKSIIEYVSLPDAVSLMCTSKRMAKLDGSPEIWQIFLPRSINSELNIKIQALDYYYLFSDLNKKYYVSMKTLQSFRKTPVPDSNPVEYDFSIRNIRYRLTHLQAHDIGSGTHERYLNTDFSLCDKDAHVVFSKQPDSLLFQAQFTLFAECGGIVDEHEARMFSSEYDKRFVETANKFPEILNGGSIMGCTFTVERRQ